MHKVCVMTDVHWILDNRINKEIRTLVKAGYDVSYVAPATAEEVKKFNELNPDVKVFPINRYESRRKRMTKGVKEAYKAALSTGAEIYHFHDPELIRVGILLKLRGKKVIYDVHENYHSVLISRRKSKILGFLLKVGYVFFEKIANSFFDGIVVVTPNVKNYFSERKTIILPNYPELSVFEKMNGKKSKSERVEFIYIGGISIQRGIKEMVEATAKAYKECNLKLVVIGKSIDEESKEYLELKEDYFTYQKQLPHEEALKVAMLADVGMIVLHPTQNHLNSSPVKLFEYMALGLPVIASNFPKWHEYMDEANCAVYVDPMNVEDIAEKMIFLAKNRKLAQEMGERGKKLVFEKYNWKKVEKRLIDLYKKVVS